MKVRRVALTDLTESQAHKLRLLKAALEQVMGHEVQTMTLSYTDSGSPRLRVGFSVTLLGASSPAATSTAPAVPAPSPGRPPSSVVLVDRRLGGEDELVEEPDGGAAGLGGGLPSVLEPALEGGLPGLLDLPDRGGAGLEASSRVTANLARSLGDPLSA